MSQEPLTKGQNVTYLLISIILGFGCKITTPDENFSCHKLSIKATKRKFVRPVTVHRGDWIIQIVQYMDVLYMSKTSFLIVNSTVMFVNKNWTNHLVIWELKYMYMHSGPFFKHKFHYNVFVVIRLDQFGNLRLNICICIPVLFVL